MSSASPNIERISIMVAWLLCAVILLSFFGGGYQLFVPHRTIFEDFDLVNTFMWFCPAFVLLIFRRNWFVIVAYAAPILVLLFARIYFFWQLEALGTNVVNRFAYWVIAPQILLGVFSFMVLMFWIVWRFIFLVSKHAYGDK